MNRIQAVLLGFFVAVAGSVVALRVAAPDTYDRALGLPSGWPGWTPSAFLGALGAFLAALSIGVLRRWRWMFWPVTVAFLAGALRVPAGALQLTGVLRTDLPDWYVAFQTAIGVIQLAIGLAMVAAYRRGGTWGRPALRPAQTARRLTRRKHA